MRIGWAIVGGIALAAVAWWFSLSPDERPEIWPRSGPTADADRTLPDTASGPAPTIRVYRWTDDRGIVTLSDQPPTDRPYEPVDIRSDQNIVPFGDPAPAPKAPPED